VSSEYSFRNLVLWQKAQQLAEEVVAVVAGLPPGPVSAVVGRQLLAAATSIGANVAEGHGRFSLGAHRHHLSIAKGSACETDGWVALLHRAGYIDQETEASLHGLGIEVVKLLTTRMIGLEKRGHSAERVREEAAPYGFDEEAN
jgi:four helix bundle protein